MLLQDQIDAGTLKATYNCVTYGQPMVTDAAGGMQYESLKLTRVVYESDFVPTVPFLNSHFKPALAVYQDGTAGIRPASMVTTPDGLLFDAVGDLCTVATAFDDAVNDGMKELFQHDFSNYYKQVMQLDTEIEHDPAVAAHAADMEEIAKLNSWLVNFIPKIGGLLKVNLFMQLKDKPLTVALPAVYMNEVQSSFAQDSLDAYKDSLVKWGGGETAEDMTDLFAALKTYSHILEQWVQARMRVQDSQGQVTMLNQQMIVVDNAIAEDKGKVTVLEQGEQLLQMRINTLGYMALSYMKAEQKAYEYWALQLLQPAPLQLPLSASQVQTFQTNLDKATTDFREQLASTSQPLQVCKVATQHHVTLSAAPITHATLMNQSKVLLQTTMANNDGYYRVYMNDVRVYLILKKGTLSSTQQHFSLQVTKDGHSSVRDKDGHVYDYIHPPRTYSFSYFASEAASGDMYCPATWPGPGQCDEIQISPFGTWEIKVESMPAGISIASVESVMFEFQLYLNEEEDAPTLPMFTAGSAADVDAFSVSANCPVMYQPKTCQATCATTGPMETMEIMETMETTENSEESHPGSMKMPVSFIVAATTVMVGALMIAIWQKRGPAAGEPGSQRYTPLLAGP